MTPCQHACKPRQERPRDTVACLLSQLGSPDCAPLWLKQLEGREQGAQGKQPVISSPPGNRVGQRWAENGLGGWVSNREQPTQYHDDSFYE